MSQLKGSPYRDLETGGSNRSSDDEEFCSSPFNIPSTKNASIERLRRWRQATLVLNASRRFQYTFDLKKEEEKKQVLRKIREHAQAIRVAYLFKAAGEQEVNGTSFCVNFLFSIYISLWLKEYYFSFLNPFNLLL